jgi:hypothetical protein
MSRDACSRLQALTGTYRGASRDPFFRPLQMLAAAQVQGLVEGSRRAGCAVYGEAAVEGNSEGARGGTEWCKLLPIATVLHEGCQRTALQL